MARGANRRRAVLHMTFEANAHGGDAGCFRHALHLLYLAVAHLAFHSRVQVLAMRPVYAREDFIDAHPGDRLIRLRIGRELLNRGRVFGDGGMAGHARAGGRKRHQVSGSGIGVAGGTLQPNREMKFVAVGDRLLGGRVFRWIIRNFLLDLRRSGRLLRCGIQRDSKRRRKESSTHRYDCNFHNPSHGPTS